MLKVRYVRLRFDLNVFKSLAHREHELAKKRLKIIQMDASGIEFHYTIIRQLSAVEILADGAERKTSIPTMERYSVRIFQAASQIYMALLDPPRGTRIQSEILSVLIADQDYFFEPLEISRPMIVKHISRFDSARLVSAKVRDLKISDTAIARLEVASKEGIDSDIAPILHGKFFRLDSMTYEVTHKFQRGLVTYMSNGTVRAATALVETVFPGFEQVLVEK